MSELENRLKWFLEKRLPSAEVEVSNCRAMAGGYSRVMTRFTATIDGRARDLVLRADGAPGASPIETDRLQEWAVLSTLARQSEPPCPRALFADETGAELGSKAIVSEFAGGGPFLSHVRDKGEAHIVEFAEQMCGLAARVHAIDISAIPALIDRPSDWSTYLDGLIDLWRSTAADLSESLPMLSYVAAWLERNRPAEAPLTLVHGEFQPGNQVYSDDGRLLAVDWEFAHIGDPREDLGWAQWVEAIQPPALIGRDTQAFCDDYCHHSGLSPEIVNPMTIAYFSILPAIRVFDGLLRQQQAFVEGTNTSVRTAYLIGGTVTAFEGWFHATREIEAAAHGALA